MQNNFILDGVDNNSHIMGLQDRKAQVLVPNLDAVQEFQIQTSNYTAEFGRGAGAVMNVSIKSGTNAVRGTAHEFLRNDVFDARDAFDYYDRTGDGKADPDALRQQPVRIHRRRADPQESHVLLRQPGSHAASTRPTTPGHGSDTTRTARHFRSGVSSSSAIR